MSKLIGRERELSLLESAWESDEFKYLVLYGRRRVGKTFLLGSFLEGRKHIYLQATKDYNHNLTKLSNEIGRVFFSSSQIMRYRSFSDALSVIVQNAREERIALVIDEISFFAEADESAISVLQSFVDHEAKESKILLILSGSNMSFMENDLLGVNSPLYGRRDLELKLMPFSLLEAEQMLSSWEREDVLKAYTITGGIPLYLKRLGTHEDLETAIRKEFFTLGGALLTEARLYLMMEVRSIELYDAVLSLIALGKIETNKIASKSGRDSAAISQALKKLDNLKIVRKRKKVAGRGLDKGWQIVDGYFLFFYRYVYPYLDMIDLGAKDAPYKKAMDEINLFASRFVETLFQRHVLKYSGRLITEIGNVEFPNPETRRNEELDLVALEESGAMIFGECKWRERESGYDVYENLVARSNLAYPAVKEKSYVLLSKGGYSESLKAIAKELGKEKLWLLTADDLFF